MVESVESVFETQQQHKFILRSSDASTRIKKLKHLRSGIEKYERQFYAAMQSDLRKCNFETAVTELYFTYAEIDFAIKHLKSWMRPVSVKRNISNLLATNKIYYEPKGVCLIIAPWNYPFQLTMSPLISAIAAGNTAILKPSELSSHTAAVIHKMITELFESNEVACFEGDAALSTKLLALPFDHIFFTGSTAVGKIVMNAASKHLTSVTLELGGKSPALIHKSADLKKSAEKIAWGKLVNAGQTCIAPDYVLIDETLKERFITYYIEAVESMFFKSGKIDLNTYGRIINAKQFSRLNDLIDTSVKEGAQLIYGGGADAQTLTILPTLLTGVSAHHAVMQEEIFGPVLPVLTYQSLDVGIDLINQKSKPLALYIFSEDRLATDKIIRETSSGGTCVNDVLVHISNPNLPFGGVNSSGIGSSHGVFGFKNFSHERAVVFQSKFGFTKMIYPPYDKKSGLLKWLKKIM